MLSGAIFGALVGLILACFGYVIARGMQKKGNAMGKAQVAQLVWTGEYRAGLDAARRHLESAGGVFLSEDPQAGLVLGRVKSTLATFGSTVKVQFHGPVGATQVEVSVAPTLQAIDYGASKKFLDAFVRNWKQA